MLYNTLVLHLLEDRPRLQGGRVNRRGARPLRLRLLVHLPEPNVPMTGLSRGYRRVGWYVR
jgi:hypothetical protein